MNRPRAYSYVRFSTPEQMRGDSFRRQTEAAARYAATHGLALDETFSFHDLGVSAFHGRNRAEGMLGEFLAFVRSGDIPRGSYLLVENLDRVSRENALDALRALEDIAREGITVVTLSDGRQYTYENMRTDFVSLMVALLMFSRANEESATKARRLREAWGEKRRKASTTPMTRICPAWMRLREDRSAYELIPERAEVVRNIYRRTLDGVGQHAIAETLNRDGVPVFGRGKHWQRSYVKKLLENPAVVGTYVPHTMERNGGQRRRQAQVPVEDYFPAVVDRDTFERVRLLSNGRAAGSTRRENANILSGLAKCPLCGSTMTRVNKGRKGGKPYLVCTVAKAGAGCEYRQIKLDQVQNAIVEKAGELIADMPSPNDDLQTEWDNLERAISATDDAIRNIVEAVEDGGPGKQSKALMGRLVELETARDQAKSQQVEIGDRLAATLTNRTMNIADNDFVTAVEAGDVARVNVAMRQLFERVVVNYQTGMLEANWKHVPGAVSEVMFMWPRFEQS